MTHPVCVDRLCFTQGNVKDFQLWVVSRRDNVPYPLIGERQTLVSFGPSEECVLTNGSNWSSGHEFPFSIQMSHVRHTVSQRGGDAAAPPLDRQVALQVEQLQVYKHCQFVLKPRPTETPQAPAGEVVSVSRAF